ncbi:MAG TPA: beta-1,3-glucanase family protein [Reyranella sp.]|nr:beta-1,3-glucanase family protein [Reyranella sp.]
MATETRSAPASGAVPAQLIIDLTQTDLPADTPVYAYVIGEVSTTSTNYYYYLDANFMPQLMSTGDNTIPQNTCPDLPVSAQKALAPNYPSAWADWSMSIQIGSNLVLPLGNINTANIPYLGTGTAAFSGRIYLSVGAARLPFTVTSAGYTAPVFGLNTGMPGSMTLYDWIEFSYDSEGNFDGNTTQVDQFGFPLLLTGTPVGSRTPYPTQGGLNTSRATIMNALNSGAAPFTGPTVMVAPPQGGEAAYPPNIAYLRAVSPKQLVAGAGGNPALSSYFNSVITAAYTAWQSVPLVVTDASTGAYTGVVYPLTGYPSIQPPPTYVAGSLGFYPGAYSTMAALVQALQSPNPPVLAFCLTGSSNTITSSDILQCAGSLASGGTAQKNVGKIIAAAFNRGMVLDSSGDVVTSLTDIDCANQAPYFYKTTTYNQWADIFHGYNTNGLAYGFPYDDVCNQSSSIPPAGSALVAQFIRIALGKFYS